MNRLDQTGYQEVGTLIIDLDHFKNLTISTDTLPEIAVCRNLESFCKVSVGQFGKILPSGRGRICRDNVKYVKRRNHAIGRRNQNVGKALNIAENLTLSIGISIIPIKRIKVLIITWKAPTKRYIRPKNSVEIKSNYGTKIPKK